MATTPTPSALIDEARVTAGLSRPQMERLLQRYGMDNDPPLRELQHFLMKLVREYERFMKLTVSRTHEIAEVNGGWLLTAEVSEVTGMGEFQVANLRRRGKLQSYVPEGQRYPRYRVEDVLEFVNAKPKYREHHSPLSWGFLRTVEARMPLPRIPEAARAPELAIPTSAALSASPA
jgi:hypothetical protein